MDSLRYWVTEMHVDGFRFDLAAALARQFHEVDRLSAFFDLIQQDPVVSQVKLIAEPWDVGDGGYQVGNFPPLWSEWNGKYRDTVRDFWRGEPATLAEFAYRLTGSSDLYQDDGRRPVASINFVTAPRRLHAARPRLLQRQAQRGERRGQPRRRDPQPLVELRRRGPRPTTRTCSRCRRAPAAQLPRHAAALAGRADAARRRRDRAHPARQQQRLLPGQRDLLVRLGRRRRRSCSTFTAELIALRREHPVFRRRRWFQGRPTPRHASTSAGCAPDGDRDDRRGLGRRLRQVASAVFLNGDAIPSATPAASRSSTTRSCSCSTHPTARSSGPCRHNGVAAGDRRRHERRGGNRASPRTHPSP